MLRRGWGLRGLRAHRPGAHPRGGGRSARVAAWLNQNGYDAVNVGGGMGEWEAAGRPMVSETGQEPFVR